MGVALRTIVMVEMVLFICCPATAAAATAARTAESGIAECAPTAAAVAQTAQRVCGGAPVEEALRAVGLQRGAATDGAVRLLTGVGLRTALDLRLVARGGAEADEVMGELKAGGVSLGDRAKIRLLVGEDPAASPPSWEAVRLLHAGGQRGGGINTRSAESSSARGGKAEAETARRRWPFDRYDRHRAVAVGRGGRLLRAGVQLMSA